MKIPRLRGNSGVTLIEVTLSIAIFAVVISVSAQSLMGFYAAIDIQEQRVEAIQAARAILSDIRLKREDFNLPNDGYDWAALLAWINAQNDAGWAQHLRDDGPNALPSHSLSVTASDLEGNPAEANDNPIEIEVTTTWQDLRGRTTSSTVATIISER